MIQQTNRKLDSNNIRATLETSFGEHLEFMCERPTVPVTAADMKRSVLWQEYQSAEDVEIDVALEELDAEFVDIDLEGLQ